VSELEEQPLELLLARNLISIISRLTRTVCPGALSPARVAAQSRATAKAGRNQHIHGCPWKIGSAVLRSRESP
jgi:hypothetical protein